MSRCIPAVDLIETPVSVDRVTKVKHIWIKWAVTKELKVLA